MGSAQWQNAMFVDGEFRRPAGGGTIGVRDKGGNNARIVLDDADLDQATMIGAWSSFHYQAQTCITAGRHIVQRGSPRRTRRRWPPAPRRSRSGIRSTPC